jgi:hypothetical protein
MAKRRAYISVTDPAKIEIAIGQKYIVSDYRSHELPGYVILLTYEADTQMYKCQTDRGGHVWHKRGEFIRAHN